MSAYEQLISRLNKAESTTEEVQVGNKTVKVNTTFAKAVSSTASWYEAVSQQLSVTGAIWTKGRESVREDVAQQLLNILDK